MTMIDEDFIKNNFYFNGDFIYFNHGTFGICPKPVLEERFKILRKFEENPVIGFAETMFDGCIENTEILANKFGVSYNNLAVIENVTTGFHSVLHSIPMSEGDEILLTNFTYAAVRTLVEEILGKKGCVIRTFGLNPPFTSNEEIISLYQNFVLNHPNIKYAIIDHISCGLPFVQPVKEITKVLRQLGVFVMIDGAHAPGHVKDLNIHDIDADIYIGNLHKWCFLPRGTGFMAVGDNLHFTIQPPIISYLHDKEFFLRFIFMGTNDISNILCIKHAFNFIDTLGGWETIHCSITNLLEKGIAYLEEQWNVTQLTFPEMAPFIRIVPLPERFSKHKDMISEAIKKPFQRQYYNYTMKNFKFIATIIMINDRLYFRICCHIYNTFENFVRFSSKIFCWLDLLENGGGQINL